MKANFDLKALAFKFSRMKGHEDDGLFFGVEEALPTGEPIGAFRQNP
jgi:hypothetical protein